MVSYEDLTDQQQRAVDALDRSVTLTAGAGTGKTTTLTTRYLEMIERSLDQRADGGLGGEFLLAENILTTTFTERAANELRENIQTEITDRIASLEIEEFPAWRTVADELEHGYIHTLHGFCSRILREHALTIDAVDPGFDTLDENETSALIHDTVSGVLEDYEDHQATRTLARQFSRSQLRDVLIDLLDERPESLDWAERWADATEEEYISYVESALHPIDPTMAAERLAHPDFVASAATLTEFVENPPDIDTGGQVWQRAEGVVEILDHGFDDGTPSRAKQTTIAELSTHLTTDGDRYANYAGASTRWGDHPRKDDFDLAFERLVDTLQPENYAVNVDLDIETNSFPVVTALADLTRIAAAEYEGRKDRQNAVDFTDQITLAVNFLEADENEAIRRQLWDQFEYVMVDEFQDTDPRQWDLIKLLTADDEMIFDAQNVFVVGDIKQSIYRFRNADVAQFRETAQTLERVSRNGSRSDTGRDDDTDDRLSKNFRTLPIVLESINELFDTIFVEDGEPYEAAPQALIPVRDDPASIGSVEYLAVPSDEEHRADRFGHYEAFAEAEPQHDVELEAMALAARLSQILAEPYRVYPEGGGTDTDDEDGSIRDGTERAGSAQRDGSGDDEHPEPRDIEPSDVAILIRSRTHLKKYERALENASIPYSVASGVGFYETAEITALLNLLRALADPYDERALYAALRSPLFGLTDDTLARLKFDGEPLWDALAASEHQPLEEVHEHIEKWRQLAGLGSEQASPLNASWATYLTRILEDTGYLISVSADERPQQARANIEKFREQLRGWSDDGVRSLTTLVGRIERRIDLGGRESEADTTGEGVQILTIHDAKGMEFPFVVVPGVDRPFKDEAALGSGKVEFERIGDQHAVGVKAPSTDDSFEMRDTIARETIREQRRAEERAEEKRVLYVACTRARDHLLLSGLHDVEGDAEEPTFNDLTPPDSESASSWRDWVQPELLIDDICAELDTSDHVKRSYGDGAYFVSLPTPPIEREQTVSDVDPTVGLSPDPTQLEVNFRLSATDLASLLGGYGELQLDEQTRTIYFENTEDDAEVEPSSRHREDSPAVQESEPNVQNRTAPTADDSDIDRRVFGEMVHRICELRPPESQWTNLMEQTLVDEGVSVALTSELKSRVRKHARRGIDHVDSRVADTDVEQQYDELYVTAEFERGEIAGYIDHLILTPDTYHIIDYKTGDVPPEEIEGDAEYYMNQMRAYAVALNQQGTDRSVRVSLVFTDPDEAWEAEWSPEEIESFEETIQAEIEARAPL